MDERLAAAWRLLPGYLGQHVLLSACALGLGVALSLPLAVAASRSPRLRWIALLLAGTVQTIPSLALLALFYPLLLALSALSKAVFGTGFPALGFLPSLLALTLYSMLPILRNGVAGILGVDPAVNERIVAAVREAYAYRKADKELIKQYRFMARIFAGARAALDRTGDPAMQREILHELGETALAEHAEWTLMHRERPLEHARL